MAVETSLLSSTNNSTCSLPLASSTLSEYVLQMGGLPRPNPPAHIHSTTFAGKTQQRWAGNDVCSQNLARLSKKRHVIILLMFCERRGLRTPQPPAHFLGQLLSKQIFARLSKRKRFAVLFDVLQMGRGLHHPQPPGSYLYRYIRRQDLAALSSKRHALAKPRKAQQEATCSQLNVLQMGGAALPTPAHFFLGSFWASKSLQNLARSNALPSYSMGGGCAPPNPPLIFIAPHSQARPSSAEQETTCSRKTQQRSARSDMFSSY